MNSFKLTFTFLVLFNLCYLIAGQKLNKDVDCSCRLPILSRIVGGSEANMVPWSVSLGYSQNLTENSHFCGGTIINHNYIMTVKECVEKYDTPYGLESLRLRLGTKNLDYIERGNEYKAKRVLHGLRFAGKYPDEINSFALIETDRPIEFIPNKIQPACLPTEHKSYDIGKEKLTAIGFGAIKKIVNSPYSNGDYIPSKTLKQAHFYSDESMGWGCDKHLICLWPMKSDDSVCNKDIGSSLMRTEKGITTVIGSAQYVYGHEIDGKNSIWEYCYGPSLVNRVSYHIPVLQSIVGDDFCSK